MTISRFSIQLLANLDFFFLFSWQREIGARRVGGSAQFASNDHALDSPRGVCERAADLLWRARVVALKGVLVKKHSATVLGDHVEVLRLRRVSDEGFPFMHANHMPRAVEVTCQCARVRPPLAGPRFQDKSCNFSVGRLFF